MSKNTTTSGVPFAVRNAGEVRALSGTKFRKELLAAGTYQHPTRPWKTPLDVSESYIDSLVEQTNLGLTEGVKVPLPLGHDDSDDPEKNRGYMVRAFKDRNSRGELALFGEIEVTNPDTAERIGKDLQDISVYIDKFGSGQWTPEGDRIVHVALTNYPVYAGQDNFQRLSATGERETVPVLRREEAADQKENTMKLSADLREALEARGVTLDGDEPTVEDGLKALLSVEVPEPVEPPQPTADDVPRLLSVDPKAERYFGAWQKAEGEKIDGEVEAACKSGRLTAEGAEAVKALLSVGHGYSLSAKGEAQAVDVPSLVRTILSAIPENSVVPLENPDSNEDLKASAEGAPAVETKEFGVKDAQETASRMLARLNGDKE